MNLAPASTVCLSRTPSMSTPNFRPAPPRTLFLLLASIACTGLHAALPENVIADLRAKAASGNAIAQYNLGIAYADINEPISDLSEAYAWLTLAAERGSNQAALNALLPKLSSAQLAEGKRRLEEKRAQIARAAEQSPFVTPASQPETAAPTPDAEVSRLRAELSRLSTELSAARREAEAAKTASIGKVAELNHQIAERDSTISSLKASSQAAPATVIPAPTNPALETALKESEAARANLARDLAALSTEAATLKSQLSAEQRARSQLAAESLARNDQTAELATARSQLTSLRAEIDSMRREIAQRDETIKRINAESRRLTDDLAAARLAAASSSEITQLKADLDAARAALTLVEKERDELKLAPPPTPAVPPEEFERLKKQLTDTESKLNTALRSYTLQQKEIEAAQATIASLTEERNGLTSRLEQAMQEKAALSQDVAASAPVLAEIGNLRDQLRYAQSQAAAMAVEINQLKTRLAIAAPPPSGAYAPPTRPGTTAAVAAIPAAKAPAPTTEKQTVASTTTAARSDASAAPGVATPGAARVHVVKLGDSLSKISQQYYGQSNRWEEIAAANRDVLPNPNQLVVGTSLRIP